MKNGVFWVYLVFLRSVRRLLVAACVVPSSPIFVTRGLRATEFVFVCLFCFDEGGARFFRNVGSYKSHTA
jgi:hypothetical protein